jgi:hypothetical protein
MDKLRGVLFKNAMHSARITALFILLFGTSGSCSHKAPFILKTSATPLAIPGARLLLWPSARIMLVESTDGLALIDPETRTVRHNLSRLKPGISWLRFLTEEGAVFYGKDNENVRVENWNQPVVTVLTDDEMKALQSKSEGLPAGATSHPGLKMPEGPRALFQMGMRSTRDPGRNKILWYGMPHFDASPEEWILRLWTVSDSSKIEAQRDLPAGPWVYEHGIWKMFQCFSCGCSCYEKAELKASHGKIYLRIWDAAVEEDHAGIYALYEGPDKTLDWIHIQVGQIDNFAVAPTGDAVAHIKNGQLLVTTVSPRK